MNDRKIISAIEARDERMMASIVQKYSKLLWKIAASVLINAASAQDVEECVADVFICGNILKSMILTKRSYFRGFL